MSDDRTCSRRPSGQDASRPDTRSAGNWRRPRDCSHVLLAGPVRASPVLMMPSNGTSTVRGGVGMADKRVVQWWADQGEGRRAEIRDQLTVTSSEGAYLIQAGVSLATVQVGGFSPGPIGEGGWFISADKVAELDVALSARK